MSSNNLFHRLPNDLQIKTLGFIHCDTIYPYFFEKTIWPMFLDRIMIPLKYNTSEVRTKIMRWIKSQFHDMLIKIEHDFAVDQKIDFEDENINKRLKTSIKKHVDEFTLTVSRMNRRFKYIQLSDDEYQPEEGNRILGPARYYTTMFEIIPIICNESIKEFFKECNEYKTNLNEGY